MIFPGRKALFEDVSTQSIRMDDLLSEFTDQNFSGYAEFRFAEAKGILLFHSGEIITAVYKEAEKIQSQEEGIRAIKNRCRLEEGRISTYQLPSEMAHLLRGLCNRRLVEEIHVSGRLRLLLEQLREARHTGTLDLIFTERREKGMILMIQGRASNTYLEMDKNLTLEGKDALTRVYELVDETDGSCRIFQSDFSQEIWKTRRGSGKPYRSRIYEILAEREGAEPSPLQEPLSRFARNLGVQVFTALIQGDGTLLAEVAPESGNGFSREALNRILGETPTLVNSVLSGEMKETLCTTADRNLLIRSLPGLSAFHVVILEREGHPSDLRKHLASLDRELADLPAWK